MASRYEDSILRSLRQISRAVDLHSKQLAKRHDLTGPQLLCLRAIERGDLPTPSRIAKAVSLSQATVTGILDRLERRGLVTRTRSEQDRRRVNVALSDEGRALIDHAPPALHERFSANLAAIPDGEQAMIEWIMRRLVELMEATDVDAAPMMTTGPATAEARDIAGLLGDDDDA